MLQWFVNEWKKLSVLVWHVTMSNFTTGDIRLINESTKHEGRVEWIKYGNQSVIMVGISAAGSW